MERNKIKYAFEFQEFIAINDIKIKKLPKLLRKLIKNVTSIEATAKKECTLAHYKYVKDLLKSSANDIMDELYEVFQDHVKNNEIVEVEEKTTKKPDETLLEIMEKEGRDYVKTVEVYRLGIIISKQKRTMVIGDLTIRRGLGQDHWKVISKKQSKGGNDE